MLIVPIPSMWGIFTYICLYGKCRYINQSNGLSGLFTTPTWLPSDRGFVCPTTTVAQGAPLLISPTTNQHPKALGKKTITNSQNTLCWKFVNDISKYKYMQTKLHMTRVQVATPVMCFPFFPHLGNVPLVKLGVSLNRLVRVLQCRWL